MKFFSVSAPYLVKYTILSDCKIAAIDSLLATQNAQETPVFMGTIKRVACTFILHKARLVHRGTAKPLNTSYTVVGSYDDNSLRVQFLFREYQLRLVSLVYIPSLLLFVRVLLAFSMLNLAWFVGYYLVSDFVFHLLLRGRSRTYYQDFVSCLVKEGSVFTGKFR